MRILCGSGPPASRCDRDKLGSLLALRAQSKARVENAKQAASLRAGTLGLLRRLRSSIQDEVAGGAKLPEGYEAKLFATFDELNQRREEAAHRKAVGEVTGEAATTPELTSGAPAETAPAK